MIFSTNFYKKAKLILKNKKRSLNIEEKLELYNKIILENFKINIAITLFLGMFIAVIITYFVAEIASKY